MIPGQLDALELLRECQPVPTGPVEGFGLHLSPEELDALREQWGRTYGHLTGEAWRPWRGWRPDVTNTAAAADYAHACRVYTADLRPARIFRALAAQREQTRATLQDLGALYYRVRCHDCQWWSHVHETEDEAVTEYLHHCWPGWETLPLLCKGGKPQKPRYTIPADYPGTWTVPGAPWRDCRHSQHATRSHQAPAGPFKHLGYSVATLNPECPHYQPSR